MKVSAVIVTRGNVDLGPALSAIDADEIIIRRGHGGVWERWCAVLEARHDVVYTQDDDAAVDFDAVMAAYDPKFMTCNMPMDRRREYQDGIALVGWGAAFHQQLAIRAIRRYRRVFPDSPDPLFLRECDRVITGLSPLKLIDIPFAHLPHAFGKDRMGAQLEHGAALKEIRQRIYQVRDAA
jgi:hypothetical protein